MVILMELCIKTTGIVLYKSFAQARIVIIMELSIDYHRIDQAGLVKLAKLVQHK